MSLKDGAVKCPDDGTPFVFHDVERTPTSTIGFYKCPKCGRLYRPGEVLQ